VLWFKLPNWSHTLYVRSRRKSCFLDAIPHLAFLTPRISSWVPCLPTFMLESFSSVRYLKKDAYGSESFCRRKIDWLRILRTCKVTKLRRWILRKKLPRCWPDLQSLLLHSSFADSEYSHPMDFDSEVLVALAHLDNAPTPATIVKISYCLHLNLQHLQLCSWRFEWFIWWRYGFLWIRLC